MANSIDYSVYLVTDPTPAVLGPGRSVVEVVSAAIRDAPGCIGVVQLRDKTADARGLLATLEALHALTGPAGVPLLVNDRVDVAVAAMAAGHCEGVHLGQDDLAPATARDMLPVGAIIGVTASTPDEAVEACRAGAAYVGLGTVFSTATKTNTKHVVGPAGIQRMLRAMAAAGFADVPAVVIGGLHAGNVRHVLFQSTVCDSVIDDGEAAVNVADHSVAPRGAAVVSAIMGAADPGAAARALAAEVRRGRVEGPTAFYRTPAGGSITPPLAVGRILQAVSATTPLLHNMTNLVVQNFAANVALAIGASPIMANSGGEAADLAQVPGSALVVNMGSVSDAGLAAYAQAIRAYNAAGRPVIYDPVGAGATELRRQAVRVILNAGYVDVIKGNAAEIQAVHQIMHGDVTQSVENTGAQQQPPQQQQQQRGVDGGSALSDAAACRLVRSLARRSRCVVVMTGATDFVADSAGARLAALTGGHPMLAHVTGTGCVLGTVLAGTVSAAGSLNGPDAFDGAVAGVRLFARAAELAVADSTRVHGPGSFVPVFLDTLAQCQQKAAAGDMAWLERPTA